MPFYWTDLHSEDLLYYSQLTVQPVMTISFMLNVWGVGNAEFHSCVQRTSGTCQGPHKANMEVKPHVTKTTQAENTKVGKKPYITSTKADIID